MLTVRILQLTAVAGLFALAGCTYPHDIVRGSLESDKAMTFDMAGPISIDVTSFNGHVVIEADEDAEQVHFQVVREGNHGLLRGGEAEQAIQGIDYEAKIVPGELGPELTVRTWTDTPESHFQMANIYIAAPAINNVKVVTNEGAVRVEGMQGTVDITTREGDVVVMTNQPMTRPVTIVASEGSIDYRVRAESTGRFDAETVRGTVRHRLRFGRYTMEPTDHNALRMTLNDGENPVRLRTVDGDIRIAVVHNPVQTGTFIIEP